LDSLLEVTLAINNNVPEEAIYKIYNFTLRANLNISKLALFVLDKVWECKANFGTNTDFYSLTLPGEALFYRGITQIKSTENAHEPFDEFDLVIPIAHKKITLAYVFIGDGKTEDAKQRIDTVFVQTLSNIVIVAIENKKLARKQLQQEALNREMEIAQQVQLLLFPKKLPDSPRLNVKAGYFPHHSIGGDYYDFVRISPAEFLLCIADVSGKGIPAALLMSNFQASLRTMVRQTNHLTRIIEELNYLIYQNARGENFITFFAAIYNQTEKRLTYINAGHNPPFLSIPGQPLMPLEKGTTILGAFQPLPFLEENTLENLSEFTLLCYTDGVTEARNREDEEFGPERLAAFLEENRHLNPAALHEQLTNALNAFKGEKDFDDDVTLLTCKVSVNSKQ
jgi:phosphoserine phosphatase RsbU/P